MLEVTSFPFIPSTRKILTDKENINQTFPICDMYNVILKKKKKNTCGIFEMSKQCALRDKKGIYFCIPDTDEIKWCSDTLGRNVIHVMYF